MADIFVSFKHPEDREKVRPLVIGLRDRGWSVWWCAELLPGQFWHRTVQTEIDKARCIIVIWSRESLASDEVLTEATVGRKRRCLIQVRIEGASYPSTFEGVQGVDLAGWRGDRKDPRFQEVCAGVERLAPSPACNMYTVRGEGGVIREGIDGYWCSGDDDSFRAINPYNIRVESDPSRGTEEYWPANGGLRVGAAVIPEDESESPCFDADDNFVAGRAVRFKSSWCIAAPRAGSGVIVRIDTGRCAENEPAPCENHGSALWDRTSDCLLGGAAIGPKIVRCRSAIWRLPNAAVLLVKGSTPGNLFRLVVANDLLLVLSAEEYEKYFKALLAR